MKFAVAKEHRDYFQKQGLIEFEDFLSVDQVNQFNQAINQVLAIRTETTAEKNRQLSPEQSFKHGRDLWRANLELRRLTCQSRFADIASELIESKPIRLGYDQLFPSLSSSYVGPSSGHTYSKFMRQVASLDQVSCLDGILCGLIFCLSPLTEEIPLQTKEGPIDIFSNHSGHAIFFKPNVPIDFESIIFHPGQRFYLIVYVQSVSHYKQQTSDPHVHALKHLGYVFNDKLTDKHNPIVYR